MCVFVCLCVCVCVCVCICVCAFVCTMWTLRRAHTQHNLMRTEKVSPPPPRPARTPSRGRGVALSVPSTPSLIVSTSSPAKEATTAVAGLSTSLPATSNAATVAALVEARDQSVTDVDEVHRLMVSEEPCERGLVLPQSYSLLREAGGISGGSSVVRRDTPSQVAVCSASKNVCIHTSES